MKKEDWVWMPHPGHLIVSNDCRFHLNTYVGTYIVSTVGEYLPDGPVREVLAHCRGITLEGKGDARLADYMKKVGYEEIGLHRKYETMAFRAERSNHKCCPWKQQTGSDLDMEGYNDADAAFQGHMAMCLKWAKEGE